MNITPYLQCNKDGMGRQTLKKSHPAYSAMKWEGIADIKENFTLFTVQ